MFKNSHISVYINGIPIKYISELHYKNDSEHIGASCDIIVPLMALTLYNQTSKNQLTQANITNSQTGFSIIVKGKYDENASDSTADEQGFITIFDGYIYDIIQGTPSKIMCKDASYLMNIKPLNNDGAVPTTLKKILQNLIIPEANKHLNAGDVPLSLITPIVDMPLENFTIKEMTGLAILSHIKHETGINISIVGRALYANVASNTTNTVNLSTDKDIIEASLQPINTTFLNLKIKAWFVKKDSTKDSFELGQATDSQIREIYLYFVTPGADIMINTLEGQKLVPKNYYTLAQNALLKYKQRRYSGSIKIKLYPVCDVFWRVVYTDVRYPEINGVYVITSQNIDLTEKSGWVRTLKMAYLANTVTQANELTENGTSFI